MNHLTVIPVNYEKDEDGSEEEKRKF